MEKEKKTLRLVFNKEKDAQEQEFKQEQKSDNNNSKNEVVESKKSIVEEEKKINISVTGMPNIIQPTAPKVFKNLNHSKFRNNNTGSYNNTGGYNKPGGYNNNTGGGYNKPGGYNNTGGSSTYKPGGYNNNTSGGYNKPGGYNNTGGSSTYKPGGYNNNTGGGYNNNTGGGYNKPGGYNNNTGGSTYNKFNNSTYVPKSQNIFDKQEDKKNFVLKKTTINPNAPKRPFNPNFASQNKFAPKINPVVFNNTDAKKPFNSSFKPFAKDDKKNIVSKNRKIKTFKDNNLSFNQHRFVGRLDHLDLDNDKQIIKRHKKQPIQNKSIVKSININNTLSLKELAIELSLKLEYLIMKTRNLGIQFKDENQKLDQDWLQIITEDLGVQAIRTDEKNKKVYSVPEIISNDSAKKKIPVICVVGHIDHGKTSLLDRIKKTNLTAKEVGGITQSIGAYTIDHNKQQLTFIDTPGHNAFDSMRQNSLSASDYAILIVSAVDGVQAQTIQAIKDLQKSNTPFVVALTKSDLPGANGQKIKESITQFNIISEDFGGEVKFIEISSKTGLNIDALLNTLIEETNKLNLLANFDKENIQGVIVESSINSKIGPVSNVIIKNGTLNVGDVIINNIIFGKVKSIIDHNNKVIKEAYPGMPVQIIGLSELGEVGEVFYSANNLSQAEEITNYRKNLKQNDNATNYIANFSLSNAEVLPKIDIILKANTQGALSAIYGSLSNLNNNLVKLNIIQRSVGNLKDSDIEFAKLSKALVVCFNCSNPNTVEQLARSYSVEILSNNIIYKIIETIELRMKSMIKIKEIEVLNGVAKIQKVFTSSKVGKIAGCIVKQGIIERDNIAKVYRKNELIGTSIVKTLKRNKDDAKEVKNGFECGILLKDLDIMFKEDDEIHVFKLVPEKA